MAGAGEPAVPRGRDEGLATWLRAAEADAAVPGVPGRAYVFEQAAGVAGGQRCRRTSREILQALLWLLPG
ncbi:hypothetical protein ACFQV4_14835 [Streptomyces thermocarboxydus]